MATETLAQKSASRQQISKPKLEAVLIAYFAHLVSAGGRSEITDHHEMKPKNAFQCLQDGALVCNRCQSNWITTPEGATEKTTYLCQVCAGPGIAEDAIEVLKSYPIHFTTGELCAEPEMEDENPPSTEKTKGTEHEANGYRYPMTVKEIASKLGVSPCNVKEMIDRAIAKMRRASKVKITRAPRPNLNRSFPAQQFF